MSQYSHLADHYDDFFRLNPAVVDFLAHQLDGLTARRIVDVGCGTGTLAQALAQRGAEVLGVDLDESLLVHARRKSAEGKGFTVLHGDLRTYPCVPGVDAVLCLGNTLPHLPDLEAVGTFFSHVRTHLRPGGCLILQLVNYQGARAKEPWALPVLESAAARFHRRYEPLPDGRLRFHTRLEGLDGAWAREGSHDLLPLAPDSLARLLEEGGFQPQFWGDWQKAPLTPEAPSLVGVAEG